jgi:SAM-dependent methyltransferase
MFFGGDCRLNGEAENQASREGGFDKVFFDSGKAVPGTFDYYSFEDYCLTFKPLCEIVKRRFNPRRVLDIGCAKGSFVFGFRKLGVEAYGVDISSYAISCAPAVLQPFLHVIDLDNDSLPFRDDFFDFVTFFGSIEYLHNHKHVISELERVMSDGGTLLLTTINKAPKGDQYRINVHNKTFWVREFGRKWSVPGVYYSFISDYFLKADYSESIIGRVKRMLFGRSQLTDGVLVFSRDLLVSLGVLDYLILLFKFSKKSKFPQLCSVERNF